MLELSAATIAEMCGGEMSPEFKRHELINVVTLDSRKAGRYQLFVALKGQHADGHDYVASVVMAGGFAVVERSFSSALPNLIRVADPTQALGLLARNYRQLFKLEVVAITGSNGKSTVKEMLKAVCNQQFGATRVVATAGNLNNHLGVPLTLLELSTEHCVAIIEMGMNHSGELDYLSRMSQPTLACITNVMFAHAGHFESLEAIAAAKGEVFNGLNGIACIDATNPFALSWHTSVAATPGARVVTYGSVDSGCYLRQMTAAGAEYVTPLGVVWLKLKVLGAHNYLNALSVVALSLNLGCSLAAIKSGLESYGGYSGRLEGKVAFNQALIIDDTYNANPDSVKAALQAIQELPEPYWFIFADLKELGKFERQFHQEIGRSLNNYKIAKLLTIGELAAYTAEFYDGDKIHFTCNQDIVEYCQLSLPSTATLLIKGSNSMRLHEIVAQLVRIELAERGYREN